MAVIHLKNMNRISQGSRCSDKCFVIAVVYIERLCDTGSLVLTHQNVHRLIATTVAIADKFYDDNGVANCVFANSAGLPLWGMMTHFNSHH